MNLIVTWNNKKYEVIGIQRDVYWGWLLNLDGTRNKSNKYTVVIPKWEVE